MEFNFNSYDTSKQSILYCEIDKCKTVIKYKQAIEKIKEIAQDFGFNGIYEDCFTGIQKILQICDEVNKDEYN